MPKKYFFDILELVELDMGQISSNLLKTAFETWHHAFFFHSRVAFYDILLGHAQKSKFWEFSGVSLVSFFFGLSCIFLFLIFSYSDWPSTVHTSRSKISERASSRRAIFAMEPYSGREFSSEFLRIFVHSSGFFAPITLIWASWEKSFPPAEVEYKWCQIW